MMRKRPLFTLALTAASSSLCALAIAFIAGNAARDYLRGTTEAIISLSLLSVTFAFASFVAAFYLAENKELGENLASKNDLLPNGLYELVAGGFSDGKFFCYLRLQNGEIKAVLLNRRVPQVFKVVESDEKPGEYFYKEYRECPSPLLSI